MVGDAVEERGLSDAPLKPAAPPYPDNGSRADVDAWIDAVMAPVRHAYAGTPDRA